MNLQNVLKYLKIVQTISNKDRHAQGLERLGKGYFRAHRLNPYNPLSYIFCLSMFLGGLFAFGLLGVWEYIDGNPFKWN